MYRQVDPATKRCEQHHHNIKWDSRGERPDTQCRSQAVGNWDLTTGKRIKTKWLCTLHAIWWGVNRNPKQVVFEEVR